MVVAERRPPEPQLPRSVPGSGRAAGVSDAPSRPPGGPVYWLTVAMLAVMALGAVIVLLVRVAANGDAAPPSTWAYTAAAFAFLLAVAQGAPLVALVSRLGRGYWGVPLHRPADLLGLAGLVTVPLAILLLWQLPPMAGRAGIWAGWPGAPHVWDAIAVVLLALLGVASMVLSARPDLALHGQAVNIGPGRWIGSVRQWRVISSGVELIGSLYLMLYVLVQVLVASDLAIALVPGWRSAILPAYLGITGAQAGLAATVLIAAGLRRSAHWRHAVDAATFSACGKLLLAFSLLWFYLWWSEFLTYWYGNTPEERWLLGLFMGGPYLGVFLAAFGLCFVLPAVLLVWNPVRNSVAGVTVAAALTVAGILLDRMRLFVAAWSDLPVPTEHAPTLRFTPAPTAGEFMALPQAASPGLLDIVVVSGSVAAAGLLLLLALRWMPPVSVWELRRADALMVERQVLETEVDVIGRPA
ncbi:MAG: hypothetical protein AB7P40_05485 [Chloroflexota bacterium]